MITSVIIDDERNAREAFLKLVDRYLKNKLKVVADLGSVAQGVAAIYKHNPDIVFLDIEMPDENGFKLFDYFDELNFEVIFITAFNQYAVNAIKYSALDYLLKPVNFIDLNDAIKKFEKKDALKSRRERVDLLLSNMNMGNAIKSKVALPTATGYEMKKINDIIYCEGDHNYTRIYLVNHEQVMVSKTLKMVEDLLPKEHFFRIHKSYLVNLNYVQKYIRTDGHVVLLDNGISLDIASRRIDDFVHALTNNSYTQ